MSFFEKLKELYLFIKDRCVDEQKINYPSIVTIGSESSGKSSLLENITQREIFPRARTRCTICPVQIINKHQSNSYALIEQKDYSFEANNDSEVKEEVNKLFGLLNDIEDTPITITICNTELPDGLTFMDLPGLCIDHKVTHDIAKKYIEGDVLILCTVPATITRFTSDQAISLLKNNDKLKNTILVLTVPDKIPKYDLQEFLIDRLRGESSEFDSTSVIATISVINRVIAKGDKIPSLQEGRDSEFDFFSELIYSYNCDELSNQVGTTNLINTLDFRFRQYIELTWYPSAVKTIKAEIDRLSDVKKDIGEELKQDDFATIYLEIVSSEGFIKDNGFPYPKFPRTFNIIQQSKTEITRDFVYVLVEEMRAHIQKNLTKKVNDLRLGRYNSILEEITAHIELSLNNLLKQTYIFDNFALVSYAYSMSNQDIIELSDILIEDLFKFLENNLPNLSEHKIQCDFGKFVKAYESKYNRDIDNLIKKQYELEELFKNKDINEIKKTKHTRRSLRGFFTTFIGGEA
jgi:GTP-binding protein EngB required for normal cell division